MPNATYYQQIEDLLNGNCEYEYYSPRYNSYSNTRSRVCHVTLRNAGDICGEIILMIFNFRLQNGRWKIHSEGSRRTDSGTTVHSRNASVALSHSTGRKYIAIALAGDNAPTDNIVSEYVVSMESYLYGDETVYDLTNDLEILEGLGRPDFYRKHVVLNGNRYSFAYVKKCSFMTYLAMFDNRPYDTDYREEIEVANTMPNDIDSLRAMYAPNRIVFGAPGTGKSFMLDRDVKKIMEDYPQGGYERVTFHPEYGYSQFVGIYKPVSVNNAPKYTFVPGPFMRLLIEAYNNPLNPFVLLIEEINRSKVAAVFGEAFQLLDRDDSGASEYSINLSEDMKEYFNNNLESGEYYSSIKIPKNLFIWATMNSADQGVFPMDTAFKRRWSFKYIGVDQEEFAVDNNGVVVEPQNDTFIIQDDDSGNNQREIEWNVLRRTINAKLSCDDYRVNEDKLLGPYFIKVKDKDGVSIFSAETKDADFIDLFCDKVLMYLFDDAVKTKRRDFFNTELVNYNRFSSVSDGFRKHGLKVFSGDFLMEYLEQVENRNNAREDFAAQCRRHIVNSVNMDEQVGDNINQDGFINNDQPAVERLDDDSTTHDDQGNVDTTLDIAANEDGALSADNDAN